MGSEWPPCSTVTAPSTPLARHRLRRTAAVTCAAQPFPLAHQLEVLDPLSGAPVDWPLGGLPVPAFALSPSPLATWSRLLNRPGTPAVLDTTWIATPPGLSGDESAKDLASPGHLVDRFRSSHSRDAYRLAVRLSAIRPLSLPVIQLVRGVTLPDSTTAVIAEVLLGNLLEPLSNDEPGNPELMSLRAGRSTALYDFKPGVRELLSSGLNTEESIAVVDAVGRALEPYLGRMPDFAALIADPAGIGRVSPGASAFATLMSPVLDRLYGPQVPYQDAPEAGMNPPAKPARVWRFTVFGSQLIWHGDEPVRINTPHQRALFVALLLRKGHLVTEGSLVEAVWGDTPPNSARERLRLFMSRLRNVLARAEVVIETQERGYRLVEPPGGLPLDLTKAELLAEEAAETRCRRSPARSRTTPGSTSWRRRKASGRNSRPIRRR